MLRTLNIAAALLGAALLSSPALAAGDAPKPPAQDWTWGGVVGGFDEAQLQRGFKVYQNVCSACHAKSLVSFRNLSQRGGPGFTEDEVKVIASEYFVMDGPDDFGDMFEREAIPADRFPSPFPNEQAARAANGGAYPLDLSVIAKARPNGPDYIYALLTGYRDDAPEGIDVGDQYYNDYYPGHLISMGPPLADEIIEYTDGTPMTVSQYSKDVAAYLMWAAEPKLEERKRIGFNVMLYLIFLTGLLYLTKRKLWAKIDH